MGLPKSISMVRRCISERKKDTSEVAMDPRKRMSMPSTPVEQRFRNEMRTRHTEALLELSHCIKSMKNRSHHEELVSKSIKIFVARESCMEATEHAISNLKSIMSGLVTNSEATAARLRHITRTTDAIRRYTDRVSTAMEPAASTQRYTAPSSLFSPTNTLTDEGEDFAGVDSECRSLSSLENDSTTVSSPASAARDVNSRQ